MYLKGLSIAVDINMKKSEEAENQNVNQLYFKSTQKVEIYIKLQMRISIIYHPCQHIYVINYRRLTLISNV